MGLSFRDFLRTLEAVAPFVLPIIPGLPPVLVPVIIHGIQTAELLPGATGPAKKQAALELIATGIAATNAAATSGPAPSRPVIDPTAIEAASNGIDTVVGIINLINGKPVPPDADRLRS